MFVVFALYAAISFGWDDRICPTDLNILNQGVTIVSLICQNMLSDNAFEQIRNRDTVVDLTTCKQKTDWITQSIYNSMNLGRQTSSASPDGLGFAPPFAPAECW